MKSQGLPINFIVLAAVAILILVLVVGFVIGGGTAFQRSISPGVATSNCNSWCSSMQQEALRAPLVAGEYDFNDGNYAFCKNEQVVDGAEITCTDLGIRCLLTFPDGTSRYAVCVTGLTPD